MKQKIEMQAGKGSSSNIVSSNCDYYHLYKSIFTFHCANSLTSSSDGMSSAPHNSTICCTNINMTHIRLPWWKHLTAIWMCVSSKQTTHQGDTHTATLTHSFLGGALLSSAWDLTLKSATFPWSSATNMMLRGGVTYHLPALCCSPLLSLCGNLTLREEGDKEQEYLISWVNLTAPPSVGSRLTGITGLAVVPV